jgi:hypothetical protein
MRAKAKRRYGELSDVSQPDLQQDVQFTNSARDKVLNGDFMKQRLIPYLPEIIEHGHWWRVEDMKRPDARIGSAGLNRLVTRISTPEGDFNVWLAVPQDAAGQPFFYDHQYTQIERVPPTTRRTQQCTARGTTTTQIEGPRAVSYS